MSKDSKEIRFQKFLVNAKKKHGDFTYDYSKVNYIDSVTKVEITCNTCQYNWMQTPANHAYGFGCKHCNSRQGAIDRIYTQDQVLQMFQKCHGNLYNYSKVNYIKYGIPVTIICNIHGEFNQHPHLHYNGTGCPTCSRYLTTRKGGMHYIDLENKAVHLYIVEFKSDKYNFIKVGLTGRTVNERFQCKKYHDIYQMKILYDITLTSNVAITMERQVLEKFYNYRYYISEKTSEFKGCTELLKSETLESLLSYLNESIKALNSGDIINVNSLIAGNPLEPNIRQSYLKKLA